MDDIVLGRYQLLEPLGSGGMADVWLATDQRSGRQVAVKRLYAHLATDPTMVERFRREAEAAAAVDHPSVVRVLDTGPGVIVLEYVRGESLADRIRRGPLEAPLVERVGTTLASALAAVHAAGFVHRDVTPRNVILDTADVPHLTDFGIARPADVANGVTAPEDRMGTWRYLAPEVMAGATATPASDVWALGATLYEALAGHPAYPAGSPAQLVEDRRRPVVPIDGIAFGGLLSQMLDPDPERRPSAAVVSTVLAASPEAVTQVLPAAARGVAPPSGPAGMAMLRPAAPSAPARFAFPARQAALAAAGLVVAAGFVLAAASRADPAAPGSSSAIASPSPVVSAAAPTSPSQAPTGGPTTPSARGHAHGHGRHGNQSG